jgi:peptide/nickel transport system substrate-binding protein
MHTIVFHGRSFRPRVALLLGVALLIAAIGVVSATGCGSSGTSSGSSSSASATAASAPAFGGVVRYGISAPTTLDPHFTSNTPELKITQQMYSWLTVLDNNNEPTPSVATAWEMSPNGKTWTFTIRSDVKFNDGSPLTVDDVVYSFNRMRDPKIGAATVTLFKGVKSIEAPDATHVVFNVNPGDAEFAKEVADYHAGILSQNVKDPATEFVGSGPFMIQKYVPEDRIIMVKNPYYWGKDDSGQQLPYLDGITFIISPDTGSLVDGLLGGQVDFVPDLSYELAQKVKTDPNMQLVTGKTNWSLEVHLRCDKGRPAADPRIRKALRMGTDYQGLVDLVRPGLADVGNGTVVGPTYGAYYWDQAPKYDPEGAKKLLAEAGASDFTMKLYTQTAFDAIGLATAWKEQMAKIGVTVNIQAVPATVYYADSGEAAWLSCDYGVTDWAHRPIPAIYFDMSYVTDAPWPESHWSDAEFDKTVAAIHAELDPTKRAELYHQAQQILWERGPVVMFCHEDFVAGAVGTLKGIVVPPDGNQVQFAKVYFQK